MVKRGSQWKGAQWERDLVRMFREAMPGAPVFRGFQSSGGDRAADVNVPEFWIEAKVGKLPNPRQALRQADADRPFGRTPVAVVKDDRARPFVAMYLDDFLRFVSEWWGLKQDLDGEVHRETLERMRSQAEDRHDR